MLKIFAAAAFGYVIGTLVNKAQMDDLRAKHKWTCAQLLRQVKVSSLKSDRIRQQCMKISELKERLEAYEGDDQNDLE